jgi:chorismate mutase-like protein
LDINDLRNKIDALDEEIVNLLNKRTEIVLEIGKLKSKSDSSIYVPHREQEIIKRLTNLNKGPFPNDGLAHVYNEIMSACRSLEKPISVAFLGPEASGKTTICLSIIAETQKAGGTAAFIDAEHALDPEWAKTLGVKLDDLLISQPDTGEQA